MSDTALTLVDEAAGRRSLMACGHTSEELQVDAIAWDLGPVLTTSACDRNGAPTGGPGDSPHALATMPVTELRALVVALARECAALRELLHACLDRFHHSQGQLARYQQAALLLRRSRREPRATQDL